MAEKLVVVTDNRGDNKVLNSLHSLLLNLKKMDIAAIVFEVSLS